MKDISKHTLASIVTNNHHVVPVLEKYELDFCCRGKRTLADACIEKKIELERIELELESVMMTGGGKSMPYTEMSTEKLINHILVRHHFYVKQAMPLIYMHLEKVANKHGDRYPYMKEVFLLFEILQKEMNLHMQKEEKILFPRIKEMEQKFTQMSSSDVPANFIIAPISVMETEHEHVGDILYKIRKLTSNYAIPEGACTTFKVVLAELKEFEDDLHEHVHLENNILFPKALNFV